MPVVEVQFSPKGGAEVKKTAKEIADAIKAQVAATAASGDKTKSIVFTIKQARELQTAFNGDIKKTLDALVKAGIASDDIVLLMKQLNREALEGRRRTLGIAEALTETGGKMKAVKAESDGFNVSLKVARTFAKTFNGDLERTATHLRGAGASTNSIRVAMAALQVEAKGVKTETKTISQEIDEMEGKIRRGVLAAEAIKRAFEAAGKALSDLNELAGVDSVIFVEQRDVGDDHARLTRHEPRVGQRSTRARAEDLVGEAVGRGAHHAERLVAVLLVDADGQAGRLVTEPERECSSAPAAVRRWCPWGRGWADRYPANRPAVPRRCPRRR